MNLYADIPIEPREKRRLLVIFLLATVMLLGIGMVLFLKYESINRSRESVKQTYDALLRIKDVFSHLQDMETAQRGYLLTGELQFLEPYKAANAQLSHDMEMLRSQAGEGAQRNEVDEFLKLAQQHRRLLQRQIDDRAGKLRSSVLTTKEAETAKAVMDHLRSLINRLIEDEKERLNERYQSETEQREGYTRLLLLCVLMALMALIVTNGIMIRVGVRRRTAEMNLLQTREFSDTVLRNIPDGIKLLDLTGITLSINDQACRMMEIADPLEPIGKSWLDYWFGEYRTMAERSFTEAKQGRIARFYGMRPTMAGRMRWWEVVLIPVEDSEQKVTQILCISQDVTERHEADRIVRVSEQRFRDMADTMPQMIWVTLPDGYHEYYNKRWYEFTGVPEGSTDGKGWNGLFHPDDQERANIRWQQSLDSGAPYEIEYRLRRADGVYCWTLGRALPLRNAQGDITKWVGTCTVIEDQKRVENELRQARDAAEHANNAKSEFLANMSHEIRTPMNAVVGLANLLQNSNLSEAKRKEFIKTIQLSAQQLMDLINDLLDVVKLESNHVELEKIPFNLAELLEEIISVMSVKAQEKNLELVINYTKDLNATFTGDPLRLRQVLMNLVSNAVKFTPKGMVTLHAEPCKNADGEWQMCFEVSDTGIGIPANKLETIFSKFSQADTSITRKYGGTGLGLSICKTLVELMQGTISVVSTEGLGSRFTVAIPLIPADGEQAVLKNRKPMSGVSMKQEALPPEQQPFVLLVEDYKANVLVATQTIEDCGCRWELAENGVDAIEKIKTTRYDVVLMDVQMPKMDGMTATRKVREWEREEHQPRTPIVGVTAYSMDGDRDKCIEAGMDDYLSKPFNPDQLKEKLRLLTQRKP